MRCPNCGYLLEPRVKRDYTKPLFVLLLILLILFFSIGFRIFGENRSLKWNIQRLEAKIEYCESVIERYEKAIEEMGLPDPGRGK